MIAVNLEDSNQNKVVRLLLALISKRSRLTAAIIKCDNFFSNNKGTFLLLLIMLLYYVQLCTIAKDVVENTDVE